jgi:metal-dependent amidase/aminoacylase/carboxypeptidase family protein
MTVQVPPTKAEVRGAMRVQNDAVIEGMVSNIETSLKTAVTQVISKKG